jgi:5'(3')-deoxyribonucleotidase
MKVFLDMDGVLYAWNKGIANLFGINYDNKAIQDEFAGDYEGLESHIGVEEVEKKIREVGPDFWLNLELLPWAKDFYGKLEKIVGAENIYFATSFGRWPEAAPAKVAAIKRDFNHDGRKIVLIKDKFLLAKADTMLIDDKKTNVDEFHNWGGNAAVFPHEFSILREKVDFVGVTDKIFRKIKELKASYG